LVTLIPGKAIFEHRVGNELLEEYADNGHWARMPFSPEVIKSFATLWFPNLSFQILSIIAFTLYNTIRV